MYNEKEKVSELVLCFTPRNLLTKITKIFPDELLLSDIFSCVTYHPGSIYFQVSPLLHLTQRMCKIFIMTRSGVEHISILSMVQNTPYSLVVDKYLGQRVLKKQHTQVKYKATFCCNELLLMNLNNKYK